MTATRGRLSVLVDELRRRHVFRVAAVYAATSFVVLQVVDIAFPALNLPQWATTSVVVAAFLGFPLAIAVGWALERAAPPPSAATAPGVSAASTGAVPSAAVLAVLPFTVRGGAELEYLGEGLVDLLSSRLRTRELRCVDPHTLLSYAARAVGTARDPGRGRRIAERFGADLFVLGNVLEAGGRLHIEATLYATDAGPGLVAEASAEGPTSQLFTLVDTIARQLLAGLTGGPAARLTHIAVTTTDSFEALKAYLEGESEMRAMRRTPAAEAFRRAVEHDPGFALAWYRLAVAALWSGQLELSRDAIERADGLTDRLSEHDRMLVQAFSSFLRGEADAAERLYRTIVGNHPDDLEAWYQLGETLFHYRPRDGGSMTESRGAWERVLSLEPGHMSALTHLAVIAACEGNRKEMDDLVDRAQAISPQGDAVIWMLALQAWEGEDPPARTRVAARLRQAGDFGAARAAWYVSLPGRKLEGAVELSRLLTESVRSPDAQSIGHLWLAHLEVARGRLAMAHEQLSRVAARQPDSALLYRSLLALAPFLETSERELETVRQSLESWDANAVPRCLTTGAYFTVHNGLHPQLRTYLLGLLAAHFGEHEQVLAGAQALLELEGRPEARDLACDQARALRASVDTAEGRDQAALGRLEDACTGALFELGMASPFYSRTRERWLRARLLERLGRVQEALCWYGSFEEQSIYDLIYVAPSHLRRAELHERLGDERSARSHYERYIALWSEADEPLQSKVREARARLGRLTAPA